MIVVSFLVGKKFGKSSKSTTKSPCSPHPVAGAAVAEEAGNGLADVAFIRAFGIVCIAMVVWVDDLID